MKLEITFKSGAQVVVDVTEFSTKRSQISGQFTELTWTAPEDWARKLTGLDLTEIACLVAVEES